MFSRLSTLPVLALALLAVATPNPVEKRNNPVTTTVTVVAPTATTVSQCNTGSIQCCESVQSASSESVTNILGLLGVVLSDLDVLVGLTCSPLSIIGVGSGSACTASPVCCENNSIVSILFLISPQTSVS
ncbi:hypothetical protein NM688_g8466 [Phlebia brevispora]|uniref:Uncharacterized protein n=1 Tax=Phlebia brevispora TaxID=194682 RepID=A0ACC1RSA5_9APHY|nr:hypothetical protein NM688_g8466 [Phlebia brevispora]